MSELTPSQNKKARLGRGLGSLLGGGADLTTDERPLPTSQPQQTARPTAATPAPTAASAPAPAPQKPIDETTQIWKIAVDKLLPNAQQPRQHFAPEALAELTASIKEKGILQPIVARRRDEKTFEIIAGERRWRAAQAAGLHEVPVILKKIGEQDSLELAIIENIQRADLNPMEEAEAYDHLMREYKLTQQQVADKVGKDRATIANSLRFLVLAPEIKDMLRKNLLSAGHAKVILSVQGMAEQTKLAKQIVTEKLSVRAAEQLAARMKPNSGNAAVRGSDINLDVSRRLIDGLSSELQKLLGTKVQIDYANSKGKIAISFYSDEELTQIVEKLRAAWQK